MPDEAKRFLERADLSSNEAMAQTASCRFPLSLGETKLETDKQGELCTVFDVVYNDQALKQAKAFRCFTHIASWPHASFAQPSDIVIAVLP